VRRSGKTGAGKTLKKLHQLRSYNPLGSRRWAKRKIDKSKGGKVALTQALGGKGRGEIASLEGANGGGLVKRKKKCVAEPSLRVTERISRERKETRNDGGGSSRNSPERGTTRMIVSGQREELSLLTPHPHPPPPKTPSRNPAPTAAGKKGGLPCGDRLVKGGGKPGQSV